jgi:hypothetical protein
MDADEIDNADWNDYINKENALFSEVKRQVTDKLDAEQQTELNRYYSHSPIYPDSFPTNWNRSYIMMPDGKPKGAVVLLHGLTDTPTACGISPKITATGLCRHRYQITGPWDGSRRADRRGLAGLAGRHAPGGERSETTDG